MRFDLNDEQRMVRDVTREFLASECPLDTSRRCLEDASCFDAGFWKRAADLGWASLLVPESLGGVNLSAEPAVDLSVVAAERGRGLGPGPLIETNVAVDALARTANNAIRDRYLPALLEGSEVAAWCADHSAWLSQRQGTLAARQDGGHVVVTGRAVAAVVGPHTLLLVSTPELNCLIAGNAPGVDMRPLQWLDATTRHSVVTFHDVRVPAEDVLSTEPGEMERQSRLAWVAQSAELTGVIDAVFAMTLQWLDDRYSFGRPLSSYQALKHRCADMKVWQEASHAIADAAATALSAETDDAGLLARAAKAYVAEHALELIQDCVQLHGGIGVTWEHDLHLYLRRAMLIANSYGTPAQLWADVGRLELDDRQPS